LAAWATEDRAPGGAIKFFITSAPKPIRKTENRAGITSSFRSCSRAPAISPISAAANAMARRAASTFVLSPTFDACGSGWIAKERGTGWPIGANFTLPSASRVCLTRTAFTLKSTAGGRLSCPTKSQLSTTGFAAICISSTAAEQATENSVKRSSPARSGWHGQSPRCTGWLRK